MSNNFFVGNDAQLYTGSQNFSTKITATPTAFGLVAAQATAYAAANSAFATAYLAAIDPETRTQGKVAAKNAAKISLKAMASDLAKIIDGTSTVTNEQKIDLGLSVRHVPAPIPPPSAAPGLDIVSVVAWTVKIKLHDSATGSKRTKPGGVNGATVLSYVGATPPSDMGAWKFEGSAGRTVLDIVFDNTTAPGTKVWLTAFWFNGRKQSGPACTPVSTNLQGGSVSMAA